MDRRDKVSVDGKYQVQQINFKVSTDDLADAVGGQTFALTFKSKLNETFTTVPIPLYHARANTRQFILHVEQALERLPNGVIDDVEVAGYFDTDNIMRLNITFVGETVQGPQHLITVRDYECLDGCTPQLTGVELMPNSNNISQIIESDFNSYECGRRGKCDYNTGICNCFAGYSGNTCGTISCLV
jgi:hypothetical protein